MPVFLEKKSLLQMAEARTVQFGTESIAFSGYKLWHGLSNDSFKWGLGAEGLQPSQFWKICKNQP